jgi:hypothetical protein
LRSARAAHSARAATRARERSAHSGKQARRRCLEAWSCLPPLENGRKLSRRLQVGNNTARDFAAASCETSGQQKRNVIHISSTAYEQDHSGAPPRASIAKPGPNMARHEGTSRAPRSGQIQNRHCSVRATPFGGRGVRRSEDRLLKCWPELQICITQLTREGSPPPGLHYFRQSCHGIPVR